MVDSKKYCIVNGRILVQRIQNLHRILLENFIIKRLVIKKAHVFVSEFAKYGDPSDARTRNECRWKWATTYDN